MHQLGQSSGTFDFEYEAYTVQDKFEIIYQGNVIRDTGFVSAKATISISYSGSSTEITVKVTGNPGTAWDYTVNCPAVSS